MSQKLLLKDYKNNKGFVTFDERLNYVIFSNDYFEDISDREFSKDNLVIELSNILDNDEKEIFLSAYLNNISINDLVKVKRQ